MKHFPYRFLASLLCVQTALVFSVAAEEVVLHPDGLNADAGWALGRIGGELSNHDPLPYPYSYPDTTVPVRLYLIDTAVANPATFTTANPNLTFEGPILVHGNNDPAVSTPRAHGTQMLSLISGVDTGVAPGTPVHVVNFDIYPSETTTISLLSAAIIQAVQHHRDSEGPDVMRSAICVATSSAASAAESAILSDAIDFALSEGIPVILSAGNLGQDASSIVPSSSGSKNGVICVGASDRNDIRLSNSNFGLPVDILAPGDAVRTRSMSAASPFVPMTGTSPAAALAAGSVLAELSINGSLTPAQVESAIKASAVVPASGPTLLRRTYASAVSIVNPDGPVLSSAVPLSFSAPESSSSPSAFMAANSSNTGVGITPSVDADSDTISDMVEIFHTGSHTKTPPPPTLSTVTIEGVPHAQFRFPIAFDLFQSANPFMLSNGFTWGVQFTSNLKTWDVPVGSLSKTTDAKGQNWLIATFPAGQASCFAQIVINPPTAATPATN